MIPLPSIRSLSGSAVQGIVRDFVRPEYPPADYRKLRAENLKRTARCSARASLNPA